MFVNEALNCSFKKLASNAEMVNGEYNPCFVINRRTGRAFDYVISAMDQYYEKAPNRTRQQVIANLHQWSYWLEAVFYRFLLSAGAKIELRHSEITSNPDYFIPRHDTVPLVLDCKYKNCLTDQDKLYISNTNELQAGISRLQLNEQITIVADFEDDYAITSDDATELTAFLSSVMPSIKIDSDEVAIPFPIGEGFIRRSRKQQSSVNLRAVDRQTSINVTSEWLSKLKKQHEKHMGDLVGCFYLDTGMFTKNCPNEQLMCALLRQTTVKMLIVFAGSHPGEIATKGVSVITKTDIHRSVMPRNLGQFLK